MEIDKIPLKSEIMVATYEVPDALDDRQLQLAAAEALPGMADRIQHRAEAMLRHLQARFAAGRLSAAALAKRCERAWHNARLLECRAALNAGEVPGVRVVSLDRGSNLILRGFYEDLFARFVSGNDADASQTLQIKYLALGLSYAQSVFTQSDLTHEFFRKALNPDDTYDDGISTFYASLYLTKGEANPLGNTTVVSATSTTITIPGEALGFSTGCRVQVTTANNTYNCTVTVSGPVLTCSDITGGSLTGASAFDPSDIPQAGDTVIALIAEGGFIIGNDATGSANTGKAMNRRRLETVKTLAYSKALDYILTAQSLET